MKQKILMTIIFGMIFLIGILGFVSADGYGGVINNVSGIYINDFVAGSTTTANFSFNYIDNFGDEQYPHILRINITSEDQINYPVWKGDFKLNGFVKKYRLWPFPLYYNVNLNCSEESPLTINSQLGPNTLNVLNGTFYCYNTTSNALDNLKKHDEVYLTIKSNPALWPGNYNLTAEIFYMNDTLAPFVNIINKNSFETYYREIDNVEIIAEINDGSTIIEKWGMAFLPDENITFPFTHENSDLYYFSRNTPVDIPEGNYPLFVFAEDEYNNLGNDSVTLKIDRAGPGIILIQPNSLIYDETIPVKLNVIDAKSGVDNSSVFYRISEIVNGTFCPDTGVIFGNYTCYNSGWMSTQLNTTSGYYEDEFNATNVTSGSYYFEAEAEDILGNKGVL